MDVVIYGAGGLIGSQLTREAIQRGHEVTAVLRDPSRAPDIDGQVEVIAGDVLDTEAVGALARGRDAMVSAVGAGLHGPDPVFEVYRRAAESLVTALRAHGETAPRLLVVGGAGSLEVAPGVRLVDTSDFPEMFRTEALAQAEALEFFRNVTDVAWTYISPAALIQPGDRTGRYRTGGDTLITDEQGNSAISIEDYAAAFVDELEAPTAIGRRLAVAY